MPSNVASDPAAAEYLLTSVEQTSMDSPTPPGDVAVPRKSKTGTPAKTWADRKAEFKSVQLDREMADGLLMIGRDSDPPQSIAEVVRSLLADTVAAKQRAILEKKLRELGGGRGRAAG
jgi:hypothetical protein